MSSSADWIVFDPKILGGKPVIRGTRLGVQLILGLLARGSTREELLSEYPGLAPEGIAAALEYAAEAIGNELVWQVKRTA